jgi:hypothetical protein
MFDVRETVAEEATLHLTIIIVIPFTLLNCLSLNQHSLLLSYPVIIIIIIKLAPTTNTSQRVDHGWVQ